MKITGTAIKLGALSLVLLLFTALIIVVFGQLRFDSTTGYSAIFKNASGLRAGQFVRASGVEVGKVSKVELINGGNGYSLNTHTEILGAGNPYVYPDNLPRVNAHGGPEGRPGCWQPVTRDLWPQPYLVMDDGASIAPYNHIGLGQPFANEYVWGRQIGENTINP